MNYKFDTQYFAVTEKSILLLRNRFPYREILPKDIVRIEFTKGSDVKRPIPSILFGLSFILIAFYLPTTAIFGSLYGERVAANVIAALLSMELFFLSLGIYSILRALPIHSVVRLSLLDGEIESLSIREIKKRKKMDGFIQSLEEIIDSKKIFKINL
ncbi:MAG TPA: hypothetical protein VGQ59_00950 [Cyclobacteriaceae bacterium]|jgi:hypothetical protein|nr:hypothetical protein [Cyclobacteriaceae bacterium]